MYHINILMKTASSLLADGWLGRINTAIVFTEIFSLSSLAGWMFVYDYHLLLLYAIVFGFSSGSYIIFGKC